MADHNVFAPPGTEAAAPPLAVPIDDSILGQLREGFRLTLKYAVPIVLVVLIAWIPIAGLAEFLYPFAESDASYSRISRMVSRVASTLYVGGVLFYIDGHENGESIGILQALSRAVAKWFPLFLSWLVAGIGIFLSMLLLIVPGFYVWIRFALLTPVVVLEDRSMSRAWDLGEDRVLQIAAVCGIGACVALIAQLVCLIPLGVLIYAVEDVESGYWPIVSFLAMTCAVPCDAIRVVFVYVAYRASVRAAE